MRGPQILRVAVVPVCCAVVLAACGASAKPKSTADIGTSPQGVRYSDCMRTHRVPNFPDLNANGSVSVPSSINPASPAFESAQSACASLRPRGSPPSPISAPQQASFDANARCMRTHGIPDFPDPTFGPGGHGLGVQFPAGAPRPTLAALMLASHKCRHVGSPVPLSGIAGA
jgi:hypothetical protein